MPVQMLRFGRFITAIVEYHQKYTTDMVKKMNIHHMKIN